MPVYEYQCDGCGKVFEVTQRITEDPLKKHPACGSKKVKRLISQTSFQLKGTGWYVTDYAGKKPSDDKSEETAAAKAAEPKAKDDKVATKTAPKDEGAPEKKSPRKPAKKKKTRAA